MVPQVFKELSKQGIVEWPAARYDAMKEAGHLSRNLRLMEARNKAFQAPQDSYQAAAAALEKQYYACAQVRAAAPHRPLGVCGCAVMRGG